jgi:putative ABC transport system permease protein
MSTIRLVWSYLKTKPLSTGLTIFLLSLGISVITILLLFSRQMEQKISAMTKGIDLVVGAKGSPLQLILCNIFHVDFPTGNIKLVEAERLAKNRLVKSVIPLALGDSYQNFRIVGTNRSYADLYQAEIETGTWWNADLEVTVGATAAKVSKLKVGDSFASAHGLVKDGHAHEQSLYIVKGILKPGNGIIDNLIFTNIGSVWKVHEETKKVQPDNLTKPSTIVPSVSEGDSTRDITSLLIKFRNPLAVIQLPRFINTQTNMQAASPAFETARLFSILGVGVKAMMGFAYVLIFISGLSIFIALYNSLKERKYDLAIMRSMGASRGKLFFVTILEGTTLTILGSLLGITLGHAVLYIFSILVEESQKTGISAWVFYQEEGVLLLGSIVLGILCSLVPAFQAYRTDIHKVLAGN